MLFHLLGAAVSSGSGDSPIEAAWDDLSYSAPSIGTAVGNDAEVTFTGGGSRDLQVIIDTSGGFLLYRKNSGSNTAINSGGLISVVTTDTVRFTFGATFDDASGTVSVYDATAGGLVDTFTVFYEYTGTPP